MFGSVEEYSKQLEINAWHLLGNVTLAANDNWRVDLSDQASGAVAADAVAVVPAGTADTFTWPVPVPWRGSYQLESRINRDGIARRFHLCCESVSLHR